MSLHLYFLARDDVWCAASADVRSVGRVTVGAPSRCLRRTPSRSREPLMRSSSDPPDESCPVQFGRSGSFGWSPACVSQGSSTYVGTNLNLRGLADRKRVEQDVWGAWGGCLRRCDGVRGATITANCRVGATVGGAGEGIGSTPSHTRSERVARERQR